MAHCKNHIRYMFLIMQIVWLIGCFGSARNERESFLFFPDNTQIPGWRVKESSRSIDPAATATQLLLKAYHTRNISQTVYLSLRNIQKTSTLTVYETGTPLLAFGLFSRFRGADYRDYAMDAPYAATTGNALYFIKDRFCVEIRFSVQDRERDRDYKLFSGLVARAIRGRETSLPSYIRLFNQGKGVSYYPEGGAQLPMFPRLFVQELALEGGSVEVFFARRDTAYEALKEFSSLLQGKHSFVLIETQEYKAAFHQLPDARYRFVAVYDAWLLGIVASDSIHAGKDALAAMVRQMQQFEQNRQGNGE